MKKLAALILMSVFSAAGARGQVRSIELQPLGSFHGEEVTTKHGESWLALVASKKGTHLLPAKVSVETVEDPIVDNPGSKSGKEVRAIGLEEAIMLVRGGELSAGPVTQAVRLTNRDSSGADLEQDFDDRFELLGRFYTLRVDARRVDRNIIERTIRLESDEASQVLLVDTSGEMSGEILWAGDLDRDGRLDLVMNLSNHYNLWLPTLLLSSEAKQGAVVGEAASFAGVGC